MRSLLFAAFAALALTAACLPAETNDDPQVDCNATPGHPWCQAPADTAGGGADVTQPPADTGGPGGCIPGDYFCDGSDVMQCGSDGQTADFVQACPYGCSSVDATCIPETCTPSCGAAECGGDGCGGSCGSCAANETCSQTGICEINSAGGPYFAVLVEDAPSYVCSPNSKNHGAELDALELVDGSDHLAFADAVDGQIGDNGGGLSSTCGEINAGSQDLNNVKGAPDGTLTDGYVALGGGWAIAEFSGALQILPAYTLYVFEVGVAECGDAGCKDEDYSVHLTPGLTNTYDRVTVSSKSAGTAVIPLEGF